MRARNSHESGRTSPNGAGEWLATLESPGTRKCLMPSTVSQVARASSARRQRLRRWRRDRVNVEALGLLFFLGRRPDAGGEHDPLDRGDGHRRRLEVAEPVSARDRQRRPPKLVLPVPDVDPAPLSARNFTASGRFLYAAPCIAVSPCLSTALMSMPRVERQRASPRALPLPCRRLRRASACPARRPPSAPCCRRRWSASGSAPSFARVLISSASAVTAASRNGVAPISFEARVGEVAAPRHRAHRRSAPCATSFLTSSRLVIVPGTLGRRIVIADAGLADADDRVQRGVAECVGVRIGAGVQQLRGELEVRVRRPPACNGVAPLRIGPRFLSGSFGSGRTRTHFVHVGAGFQQRSSRRRCVLRARRTAAA